MTAKKRGRKPLPIEERERRRSLQAINNRKKQDARRRAFARLADNHQAEFTDLLRAELEFETLHRAELATD